MLEPYSAQIATDMFHGTTQQAPLDGHRQLVKWPDFNENRFRSSPEVARFQPGHFGRPIRLLPLRPDGGGGQEFRQRWIQLPQHRQNLMANVVAPIGRIVIRGIFTPPDAAFGQPFPNGGTAKSQQRADDTRFRLRADPAESRRPRTANETKQDRFGLIIQSVARGDAGANSPGDRLGEKFVTKPPGLLFDIAGRWRKCCRMELQISRCREITDECFVRLRLRPAKLVVHVKNCHGRAELMERRQKENRIRAAGDSNADSSALPFFENMQRRRDLIDHTSILREQPPRRGLMMRQ